MKKGLLIAIAAILFCNVLRAQQWAEVTSFDQVISDLLVFDGELFIGGSFTERENANCYWTSRLIGNNFFDSPSLGGGGFRRFAIYDGDLYATGSMQFGSSVGVAHWDIGNEDWEMGVSSNESHSGIYGDDTKLVIGSDFGKVRIVNSTVTLLPVLNKDVDAITEYNGNIIVAGRFDFSDTTTLNRIARWDGANWQPLGDGLTGGSVRDLIVYDGDLYASGTFTKAGGANALGIAKWNGASWSDVGGSITSTIPNGIRDMAVYGNELYIAGDFTEVGGVAAKYVAKWDGNTWQDLGVSQATDFVNTIQVYNNKLYAGTFSFTESKLYSLPLSTGVGIDAVEAAGLWSVYPNPTTGIIMVNASASLGQDLYVEVKDVTGKVVGQFDLANLQSIDCGHLSNGLYFVSLFNVESGALVDVKRFVKQ